MSDHDLWTSYVKIPPNERDQRCHIDWQAFKSTMEYKMYAFHWFESAEKENAEFVITGFRVSRKGYIDVDLMYWGVIMTDHCFDLRDFSVPSEYLKVFTVKVGNDE